MGDTETIVMSYTLWLTLPYDVHVWPSSAREARAAPCIMHICIGSAKCHEASLTEASVLITADDGPPVAAK